MGYRDPNEEERVNKNDLGGKKIAIYWDGDDVFYCGKVASYNEDKDTFMVSYENDDSGNLYEENLRDSIWKIWDETADDSPDFLNKQAKLASLDNVTSSEVVGGADGTDVKIKSKKDKIVRLTYTEMVIQAIVGLNEKDGSTLQAIRKRMIASFDLGHQQTASFNNLSLKAVQRALATGDLEHATKSRHSYRLSPAFKKKREAQAARAHYGKGNFSKIDKKHKKGSKANKKRGSVRGRGSSISGIEPWLIGTPAQHNQHLRQLLAHTRVNRDNYLTDRLNILKHFLPEKNYFQRRQHKLEVAHANQSLQPQSVETHSHHSDTVKAHANTSQLQAGDGAVMTHLPINSDANIDMNMMIENEEEEKGGAALPSNVTVTATSATTVMASAEENKKGKEHTNSSSSSSSSSSNSCIAATEIDVMNGISSVDNMMAVVANDDDDDDGKEVAGEDDAEDDEEEGDDSDDDDDKEGNDDDDDDVKENANEKKGNNDDDDEERDVDATAEEEDDDDEEEDKDGCNDDDDDADADVTAVKSETWKVLEGSSNVNVALQNVPLLKQPLSLVAELHSHQQWGISWMAHMFKQGMPMILADQMGLGKTIQSIGFLCYLKDELKLNGPHLIVVPLSVLSNWMTELERFAPSLRAVRFHGPREERNRIKTEELSSLDEFDVVVTTFEMCVAESGFLKKRFMWTCMIVDEGHRLKNAKSRLSERLKSVSALSKVILTGTPVQNNMTELWSLLHFLASDVFTPSCTEHFVAGFDPSTGAMDTSVLVQARALLDVFMLRRIKSQVSIRLPGKKEMTLLVPLTQRQKELYKKLLGALDRDAARTLLGSGSTTTTSSNNTSSAITTTTTSNANATTTTSSSSSTKSSSTTTVAPTSNPPTANSSGSSGGTEWRVLMNLLMQLRKLCNHTFLLDDGDSPDPYEIDERLVGGSGKLLLMDRMLPRLKADGHRILIFSQFTSTLDLLEDYCQLRDYNCARLDGETSRVRRRLEVRRFNQVDSPVFIFLISTRAGGLGLNLASADTVILYDSDWNPQMDLQATERTHRIGQTKPVRVYRLVCRGSVEQRMVLRAERKLMLSDLVAESAQGKASSSNNNTSNATDGDSSSSSSSSATANQSATVSSGPGMSQAELVSVLREGARAVLTDDDSASGGGGQMSDAQLDVLLERSGRGGGSELLGSTEDNENIVDIASLSTSAITTGTTDSSSSTTTTTITAPAAVTAVNEVLLTNLPEITLRQLEDVLYAKDSHTTTHNNSHNGSHSNRKNSSTHIPADSSSSSSNENEWESLTTSKRIRKERIVMVSGKGTGYGGNVPMLAEFMDPADTTNGDDDNIALRQRRSRNWCHMSFCCLCGKEHRTLTDKTPAKTRCSFCPLVFHEKCLESAYTMNNKDVDKKKGRGRGSAGSVGGNNNNNSGMKQTGGMYICTHHKCAVCNRATSAAGGLLFRCKDCITAYCEDCLPQDDVVSIGRCRAFEEYDYDSKQAYFIQCPSCWQTEEDSAAAVELKSGIIRKHHHHHNNMLVDSKPTASSSSSSSSSGGVNDSNTVTPVVAVEEMTDKLLTQHFKIIWKEIITANTTSTTKNKDKSSSSSSLETPNKDKEEKTPVKKSKGSSSVNSSTTTTNNNNNNNGSSSSKKKSSSSSSSTVVEPSSSSSSSSSGGSHKKTNEKTKKRGRDADDDDDNDDDDDDDDDNKDAPTKNNRSSSSSSSKMTSGKKANKGDTPSSSSSSKKSKSASKIRQQASDDSDDDEEEEEEDIKIVVLELIKPVPRSFTLTTALDTLLTHPATVALLTPPVTSGSGSPEEEREMKELKKARVAVQSALTAARDRLDRGRYRSESAFVTDIQSSFSFITNIRGTGATSATVSGKGSHLRRTAALSSQSIMQLFQSKIVPKIVMS